MMQKNFYFASLFLPVSFFLYFFIYACNGGKQETKILFAGDLMLDRGTRDIIIKNGTAFLFREINKTLKGFDFTIANFEGTACDNALKPLDKKFTFRANPEWLSTVFDNGITHLTLANNHSGDFGEAGIKQTAFNIKEHGIIPVGFHPDTNWSCLPSIIEDKGNIIAIFSSSFLKQNEISYTCIENANALAHRIKKFKEDYPTHLVFACLHWGVEMKLRPTAEQVEQAHMIIDAGADAIIGHHPHVVQSIEVYDGKYIFYSIGNFIFDNSQHPANKGILTGFVLSANRIESVEIIPVNIMKSQPKPMGEEDSRNFLNTINAVSSNLNLIYSGGYWKGL